MRRKYQGQISSFGGLHDGGPVAGIVSTKGLAAQFEAGVGHGSVVFVNVVIGCGRTGSFPVSGSNMALDMRQTNRS